MTNGFTTTPSLRSLNNASNQLSRSFERLGSGKRINRAADDAAGLAIAESLQASVKSLGQASRNISDAVSQIEITDGALQQVGDISSRLKELATQASNGTLSDEQRGALNAEYGQLTQEVQRIAATTEFNGKNVFEGSGLVTQVGTGSSEDNQITVPTTPLGDTVAGVASQNIGTQAGARSALDAVDSFIQGVSQSRGQLGASASRLSTALSRNDVAKENVAAAESRIRDLDYAEEIGKATSLKIVQQAGAAIQAHSKLVPSARILDLLK